MSYDPLRDEVQQIAIDHAASGWIPSHSLMFVLCAVACACGRPAGWVDQVFYEADLAEREQVGQ